MVGKTLAGLIILSLCLIIFFIWMRRRRVKKNKEQLEKIREDFEENFQIEEKASSEDTEILNNLAKEIKEAAAEGENTVEFTIGGERDLNIEAPDLLALKTPRCNLHKTFSDLKFQDIEKSGEDIKLYLNSG